MNQLTLLRRIAALTATLAAGALGLAGGLMLMNVRADWALALGALVSVAAPILAGVRLWAMLREGAAS